MRFTTIPKSYSSFHSPIVYGFTTQSDTPRDVEVRIIDKSTDNVIGRKRLYNICEGEIDIAPYLRTSALNTLPDSIDGCGVVDLGQQMRVVVEADGVSAAVRNFVATQADLSEPFTSLMEQHPQRTMDRNEFDIISFFSLPDVVVEVEVEFIGYGTERISITPPSGGQRAVAVTARGREGVDQIRVRVKADGEVVSVVEYQIRENLIGSRRLAWINSHRGIELYTFPLRKSILVEATRKHIETLWGREAAAVEGEGELKLLSAYEPQAQIEALGGILASPKVWLIRGNRVQSVELRTERIVTAPCGELGIIEVDIRAAEEGQRL